MTMMGQAVEQGGGHLGIAKDATPLVEGQIGRDDHAGAFVKLREQMEEQSAAGLTERQVAQFLENHQPDLVNGRLHVVVDAAPGDATESGQGPSVSVEAHFMALCRVGHQPESATGAELHVCDFDATAQAADQHVLATSVELEGFAQGKAERHVGGTLGVGVDFRFPAPNEGADASVA